MPTYLEQQPTRRPSRAARVRRRRLAAGTTLLVVIVAVVATLVTSGSGGGGHHGSSAAGHRVAVVPRTGASRSVRRRAHAPVSRPAPQRRAATKHHGPAPGTLPQTQAMPPSTSPGFRTMMADLWAGVVHNSLKQAMPAYFPKAAFLQVKAIPDAAGYWTYGLVHGFALDIAAAHALLGRDASNARLVSVNVPESYSHWVGPGTCYNDVGYYEVPNARVVYSEGGQTRSFGIASMISWRGVWYVVHLGAVLESGVVDSPSAGTGTSVDTGTC